MSGSPFVAAEDVRDYPLLATPVTLAGLHVPNRIVMAAMSSVLADGDGLVTDALVGYYKARAEGGAGLIAVEFSGVDRLFGRAEPQQLMLDRDEHIGGHRRIADAIRHAGARAAIQLHSPGQYSHPSTREGLAVAPSDQFSRRDATKQLCRALTDDEIWRLIEHFGRATRRAVEAGYEAVEIHGAHGYLPQAFLSPLKNFRDDAWGGDEERRSRFALEVVRAIRAELGPDRPLLYRLSSSEFLPGGLELDDMVRFASRLVAGGVDVIDVSSGSIDGTLDRAVDPMSVAEGWRFAHARAFREATGVPVIGVGPARRPAVAEDAIARGDIDMIALGRPLLADPDWPRKALTGQAAQIRPCTNCNWCFDRVVRHKPIGCAENPRAGAETRSGPLVGGKGRKAMVVGGGPGGMAAALDLAEAGFDTQLFEARHRLGGGLISSANPPLKDKLFWYLDHLQARIDASPIRVHLDMMVASDWVVAARPDVVLLATGAQEAALPIAGIDSPLVVSAYDLLAEQCEIAPTGDAPVLVYGGGETGCETAEYLAERGHSILLVTRSAKRDLARSAESMYRKHLLVRLAGNPGITIVDLTTIDRIVEDGVIATRLDQQSHIACARVVLAQGRSTGSTLEADLVAADIDYHLIGDVHRIGRIGDAVHAGRAAVMQALQAERVLPV